MIELYHDGDSRGEEASQDLAVFPFDEGSRKELGMLADAFHQGRGTEKAAEQLREAVLISAMKHTKVWKAYEKYRGYREQHQK